MMQEIFHMAFAVISLFALLYFAMTFLFFYGWMKMPFFKTEGSHNCTTSVSVVIAARNEEKNIKKCLDSISNQDYPEQLLEIVIVDDGSEDNTFLFCFDYILVNKLKNVKLLQLRDCNKSSKKEAIKYGVEHAKGDLIITTDADCTTSSVWISNFVAYYEKKHYKLICGPVTYNKYRRLFQQFQLLDFLSMIVSGAGAIGVHKSFIGNAANMAFEKNEFLMANKSRDDSEYASGDDVFLMHKIKEKSKNSIGFLKNEASIVYSEPKENLKELFLQRIRWASKSKGFRDTDAITFASLVFGFNLIIVLVFFAGLFYPSFFYAYLCLFVAKSLADFPLIYSICNFNKRKDLLLHYLWIQFFYPFYIAATAILTFLIKDYLWKGRRYQ